MGHNAPESSFQYPLFYSRSVITEPLASASCGFDKSSKKIRANIIVSDCERFWLQFNCVGNNVNYDGNVVQDAAGENKNVEYRMIMRDTVPCKKDDAQRIRRAAGHDQSDRRDSDGLKQRPQAKD